MAAGKMKKEWMTTQEVEDFLNYHVERIGNDLHPCSDALMTIAMAEGVREYLKIDNKPIYDIVCSWDDRKLSDWFLELEESLIDENIQKQWVERNKWMLEHEGLKNKENRTNLYNGIIETINSIEDEQNNEYNYLSKHLNNIGINNNINEFAEVLASDGFYAIIKYIEIEKRCLFTKSMDKDKLKRLCEKYGYVFKNFNSFMYDLGDSGSIGMSNKQFAYLMEQLKMNGFIRNDWQSLIVNYRIKTTNGKYLTRRDLSEAKKGAFETADNKIYGKKNEKQQEYEEIKNFVESL